MKILLTNADTGGQMGGEVEAVAVEDPNRNWVSASIDAAWAYLNYTGASAVVVSSSEPPASEDGHDRRIATVSLEIHDD